MREKQRLVQILEPFLSTGPCTEITTSYLLAELSCRAKCNFVSLAVQRDLRATCLRVLVSWPVVSAMSFARPSWRAVAELLMLQVNNAIERIPDIVWVAIQPQSLYYYVAILTTYLSRSIISW